MHLWGNCIERMQSSALCANIMQELSAFARRRIWYQLAEDQALLSWTIAKGYQSTVRKGSVCKSNDHVNPIKSTLLMMQLLQRQVIWSSDFDHGFPEVQSQVSFRSRHCLHDLDHLKCWSGVFCSPRRRVSLSQLIIARRKSERSAIVGSLSMQQGIRTVELVSTFAVTLAKTLFSKSAYYFLWHRCTLKIVYILCWKLFWCPWRLHWCLLSVSSWIMSIANQYKRDLWFAAVEVQTLISLFDGAVL